MFLRRLFPSSCSGNKPKVWVLLASLTISLFTLPAGADILISPQRAILTDSVRQAVISLHNPGTVPRAYQLSWVERRIDEDGQVISLKDGENPHSIASMVRFSPRHVMIAPGQTQTVRLDYRPPAELPSGEYRSHLRIGMESIPDKSGVSHGTEVISGGGQDGLSFRIEALMSFSVPIFVRHGAGHAEVKITSVAPVLNKHGDASSPALKVTLSRDGEFSSYGRLAVYRQVNADAPVELVGETGSVAIYTELNKYTRVVDLNPEKPLTPGTWVRVTYEGVGEERGQIFTEQSFQIGK